MRSKPWGLMALMLHLSLAWHTAALRVTMIARSPSAGHITYGSSASSSQQNARKNPQVRQLQRSSSCQDMADADRGHMITDAVTSDTMGASSSVERTEMDREMRQPSHIAAHAMEKSTELAVQKLERAIHCMSNMTWAGPVLEQLNSAIDQLEASTKAKPSEVIPSC